jgi:hypothetical protein
VTWQAICEAEFLLPSSLLFLLREGPMSIAFLLPFRGYVDFHGVMVSFCLWWLIAAASLFSLSFLKSIVYFNGLINEFC